MDGEVLRDDQWDRLKSFVPGGRAARVVTVAVFSMRCCGWPARVQGGAICRKNVSGLIRR